jgi:hypothetical protein
MKGASTCAVAEACAETLRTNLETRYRAKNSLRVFYLLFLAFSLCFSFSAWRGVSAGAGTWLGLTIALMLVLAGAVLGAQTLTSRVVLSDDSIGHGSVFRSQRMHLEEIRYRREFEEHKNGPDGGIKRLLFRVDPMR